MQRLFSNLFSAWFMLPRHFPADAMRRIRDVVAEGELHHAGELCVAIEARYSPMAILGGLQPRHRAEQVFSLLRVWDTQDNSGVLLYLQLAERRVELVADRGIAARVEPALWQSICDDFATEMRAQAPNAASTWNTSPRTCARSARASSGSVAPVFTVPALPTTQNGCSPARRSASMAPSSAGSDIRKSSSTAIRRSEAFPSPSTANARATELWASSEA